MLLESVLKKGFLKLSLISEIYKNQMAPIQCPICSSAFIMDVMDWHNVMSVVPPSFLPVSLHFPFSTCGIDIYIYIPLHNVPVANSSCLYTTVVPALCSSCILPLVSFLVFLTLVCFLDCDIALWTCLPRGSDPCLSPILSFDAWMANKPLNMTNVWTLRCPSSCAFACSKTPMVTKCIWIFHKSV